MEEKSNYLELTFRPATPLSVGVFQSDCTIIIIITSVRMSVIPTKAPARLWKPDIVIPQLRTLGEVVTYRGFVVKLTERDCKPVLDRRKSRTPLLQGVPHADARERNRKATTTELKRTHGQL